MEIMKKLSLEALQGRAESVVSNELLSSISGGTENACHDGPIIELGGAGDTGGSSNGSGPSGKPIIEQG